MFHRTLLPLALLLRLSFQLRIDSSCNAFDFGAGQQDVSQRVFNAAVEAGEIASAAVGEAGIDFLNEEDIFGSLFGKAPEDAEDVVDNLKDLYTRLASVSTNPTSVQLTIFCGDDFIDTVQDDEGNDVFVDTSKLVVQGPDNHVSTIEEAILPAHTPCGAGRIAYDLQSGDGIVLGADVFTDFPDTTSAALGNQLQDGSQLDAFRTLSTSILHELQHTTLGNPVEDQTLTRTEVQGLLGDSFQESAQTLGWTFDARPGEQACYGVTLCLLLAELHPDKAIENPDSVMFLALAAFLAPARNGGWEFDSTGVGSLP